MSQETLYICECGGEGIIFELDKDNELLLSIWRVGTLDTSWRARWEHIKQILKHGRPHNDDIILDWGTAQIFLQKLDEAVMNAKVR